MKEAKFVKIFINFLVTGNVFRFLKNSPFYEPHKSTRPPLDSIHSSTQVKQNEWNHVRVHMQSFEAFKREPSPPKRVEMVAKRG